MSVRYSGERSSKALLQGVWDQKDDWGEIRTLASEDTGALNQRLRPLGHPTKYLTGQTRTTDLGISALLPLQSPALPTELR